MLLTVTTPYVSEQLEGAVAATFLRKLSTFYTSVVSSSRSSIAYVKDNFSETIEMLKKQAKRRETNFETEILDIWEDPRAP